MSPVARLTATFVPLLSPPLQVSLQSLRWLTRRPHSVPPSSPPCRSLHLYKTARAKTILGMHKIIPFSRYDPPELESSDHQINIVKFVKEKKEGEKDTKLVKQMVAEGITLKEVYDKYIEPGKMLRLADQIAKKHAPANPEDLEKLGTAQKYKDYVILEAYSTNAKVEVGGKKAIKAKGYRREIEHLQSLREVHLLLSTPIHHYELMMDKAYRFIELGCPVEFSMRIRNVTTNKFEKIKSDSQNLFDYAFRHFPHLRPDFILKSMPEGTRYVVQPFSDGRHVQFVLGLKTTKDKKDTFQTTDLTKRALKVKKAVEKAIEEGKAHQLPKAVRFQRIEQGDENYSLGSGIAKAGRAPNRQQFIEKGSGRMKGQVVLWGAASKDGVNPAKLAKWKAWTAGGTDSRYMVTRDKDPSLIPDHTLDNAIKVMNAADKQAEKIERAKAKAKSGKQAHIIPPDVVEANRQRQKINSEKRKRWVEAMARKEQEQEEREREERSKETTEKHTT